MSTNYYFVEKTTPVTFDQHGAFAVSDAMRKARALSSHVQRQVDDFVRLKIFDWRYAQRRRLERHLVKDAAPRLEIKN